MEKATNQKHSKNAFYYSYSIILERASFYGFRLVLLLYMLDESMNMSRTEALSVYGWFAASLIISQIIGAILGDLIIGNRRAVIIGVILQVIGAFSLIIPSIVGFYTGLTLVALGVGLYLPNIISNFGKLYLRKRRLIDSGFTMYYLAVNLGAYLGTALIGIVATRYGWNIGFTIAGAFMIFSIIPMLISKEPNLNEIVNSKFSINKRVLNIVITLILIGVFWGIYTIANTRFLDLQFEFSEISALNISKERWSSINSIFIFPISLLAIIIWTYFYSSQFLKLTLGFIFGAISFGVLFFIPEIPTEQHVVIYLVAALFLGLSEVHIAPIIYSTLTKNTNPKYLAILVSLALIPSTFFAYIFSLFNERFLAEPTLGLIFAMIAMSIISIGLIVFIIWGNKNQHQLQEFQSK